MEPTPSSEPSSDDVEKAAVVARIGLAVKAVLHAFSGLPQSIHYKKPLPDPSDNPTFAGLLDRSSNYGDSVFPGFRGGVGKLIMNVFRVNEQKE